MSSPLKPDSSVHAEDSETYRLSSESPVAPEGIQPPPPVRRFIPKKFGSPKAARSGTLIGFNALVFVTSVCVMTLELTASRLVGKHVGSSLYTWTSVIGVVLAGITLGNWLGGWLADRFDRSRSLAWMYLLASLSCGSVLWLDQLVGTISRPEAFSWPVWVLTVVGSIFLLPALALGTTSPLVASMALERSNKTGSTVGNVYAWGALGSIVGTFLTGFYLIDVWGTRSIVGMTAATLAILAVIVAGTRRVFRAAVVLGWMQLLGWTMLAACANSDAFGAAGLAAANCVSWVNTDVDAGILRARWATYWSRFGEKVHELGLILRLRDDPLNQYHDESNYSDISLFDSVVDGKTIKSLKLDKLIHSYYDPSDPTYLHYEYEKIYAAVTKKVAWTSSTEPLNLSLDGMSGITMTADKLPEGVTYDEASKSLRIERPSSEVFVKLLALAPETEYWKSLLELMRESNKPSREGFSSVSLLRFPDGAAVPDDIAEKLRYDETLQVLIAYEPLTKNDCDRLIAGTQSAEWYQRVKGLIRSSRQGSACFYGGGGFIFPRWFFKEFPGSPRIDVAELDPAVHKVVTTELGLTGELEAHIHTTIGDARNFVDDRLRENANSQSPVVYDFIYADAFNDFSIPWHLTTREFLQKTHDLLSERGVFQANIIEIYPRTEFPGAAVGQAEAEYHGRLPNGILAGESQRDKVVPATKAYAPLEVIESGTNYYRLRVSRTITSQEVRTLKNVTWPEVISSKEFDVTKGFRPEIDVGAERENWRKAITSLGNRSQEKLPYTGTIPEQLNLADGPLEGWLSASAPFEFVEAYRIDGHKYLLGFRGFVSEEAAQKLIKLDPQNAAWVNAVTTAAPASRLKGSGRFMGRYVATAAQVFPNVYLFSTSHKQPDASRDTFVMVCSRQPLDLKSLDDTGDWDGGPFASLETPPGQSKPTMSGQMSSVIGLSEGQILTDDFAPVDNLLVPVFNMQE